MAKSGGRTWGERGAVTRLDRWIVARPGWAALSTTGLAGVSAVVIEILTPASRAVGLWALPVLALISYLLLFLPMSKHYRSGPSQAD